jgi:regulator of sigma E protease
VIISKILWFIVLIGPLVFVHEMGHYLVGRWCGIKADAFSIGFGREIIGWTDKRGTRWKVGWIPLGGYVRFAGDMSAVGGDNAEWQALPAEERNKTFQSKALWQKALTVAAGPVTNFLAAFLIFGAVIALYGEARRPGMAASVQPGSAAAQIGFQAKDRIVAINGRAIKDFQDIGEYIAMRPDQLMVFDIVRDGKSLTLTGAPRAETVKTRFDTTVRIGRLGIGAPPPEQVHPDWHEIPGLALGKVGDTLQSITDGLGQIIMGYHSVTELGGPIMMAELANAISDLGWVEFILFAAVLSVNLGFINLLPVPVLDGGHLLFYGIEAIRRKPVSLEAQEWAFRAGFVTLMSFMLFVTINDSIRFGYLGRFAGLIG